MDDGRIVDDVDVVVCATGFDGSFVPRFPIVGKGGRDLREVWGGTKSEVPKTYMSIGVSGMPNFFSKTLPFWSPPAGR